MNIVRLTCSVIALLILGGIGATEAAAQTATIDGSVVDSETGEAVPGAVITVEGTSISATAVPPRISWTAG